MSMTITLGWWVAPALVTVLAFALVCWGMSDHRPSGTIGDVAMGIVALVWIAGATIVSLIAWLIWALVA